MFSISELLEIANALDDEMIICRATELTHEGVDKVVAKERYYSCSKVLAKVSLMLADLCE